MYDLLVDVANACRDQQLGPGRWAAWARLDRLIDAWREQRNVHSQPLFVSDESLFRDFSNDGADARRWRSMREAGALLTAKDADEVLLGLAESTGAVVLSRDHFIGWQRRQPWIVGNDWQFFFWRTTAGGVGIHHRPVVRAADYTISRAEERDELKARGLSREELGPGGLLAEVYACPTRGCKYFDRDLVTRIPGRSSGVAACPSCGKRLISRGPRPRARRLKLVDASGALLDVQSLGDEQTMLVGRGNQVNTWNVERFAPCAGLSRRHARLDFRGGQILVEDLASANGTQVQRWGSENKSWDSSQPAQGPTTLLARDRIALPDGMFIEQSARHYVVPDVL